MRMVSGRWLTDTTRRIVRSKSFITPSYKHRDVYVYNVILNRIGGVVVSVLASSVVDCGFEPRSGQIKNYKIHICRFSAKHTALRRNSNDWLDRNQDNVSEWGDMSIRRLLIRCASTIKIQIRMLV